jgi:tetratricopeptide (TPR) repeat protein
MKFLLPSQAGDPEQRARLLREARAASTLSSSRIAAIYDIGEHEGGVFIVMELVEGHVLSERIEQHALPIDEAVGIGLQVADTLDEAHALGIVHRDIKSPNIMIDPRGRVKVLDFGLAKLTHPLTAATPDDQPTALHRYQTVSGSVLGTFTYMSPEQALGRPTDARTDLFSLGVVLYQMVTGRLPFEGATITQIIDSILHREPAPLTSIVPDAPAALEAIVMKALSKDLSLRYQSAHEMHADLLALHQAIGGATAAMGSTTIEAGGRPLPAAAFPSVRMPASLDRAVAVMSFTNITREPGDEWMGAGIAETVTTDLKKIHGLTVIGRAQVFDAGKVLLARSGLDFDERFAIEVGRRLGARWIVGGGYQRVGPLVRITAHFMEVATGRILRTVKVDGKLDDIFSLQDQIVLELSQGLEVQPAASEIDDVRRQETTSVEAYEAYSRGMMNLRMATRESMDHAIAHFERAIGRDPKYAQAHAALGSALQLKGQFLGNPELGFQGVESLRRAIEIDPKLSTAYYLLANAYTSVGHFDEAIEAGRQAVRLDPANAGGHGALARAYWYGKGMLDEGITELEHAVALNAENGYAHLQLSLLYALRRDYERAEQAARRAIDLQEQYLSGTEGLQIVGARLRLGYAFYGQGRYDEAIREYEREMAFLASGDHMLRERTTIETDLKLAAAYWRRGDHAEADRFFERGMKLHRDRQARGADEASTKYYVASAHALRGDVERAVRYLSESFMPLKTINTARARIDPDFDPIRSEPAIVGLLGPAQETPGPLPVPPV